MGNLCYKIMKWKLRNEDVEPNAVINYANKITNSSMEPNWEEKEKERNILIEAKIKEDFTTNPENFILNMLMLSTPFYKDFEQEILQASLITEDRERYFTNKLSSSQRRVLFLGAIDEVAGTHVLYKDSGRSIVELPTCLQMFIIQENIRVLSEQEAEEDLESNTDKGENVTVYNVIEEPVKRHSGYVYLRSTEFLRGLSSCNTQDELLASGYHENDENKPDSNQEIRQIRYSFHNETTKFQDIIPERTLRHELLTEQYDKKERRPSGVLPKGFNWKEERESLEKRKTNENEYNGIFQKMNAEMEKEENTKSSVKILQPTGEEFEKLRSILANIEEETEHEEKNINKSEIYHPFSSNSKTINNAKSCQNLSLGSTIKYECFIRRKSDFTSEIKRKGSTFNSEPKVYLSSTKYMRKFDNDFIHLLKILQKDHLYNTSKLENSAIHTTNILDNKYGPKFTTEYVPTVLMSKWPYCALEWKRRIRKIKNNNETQTTHNKWPTMEKIEEIINSGCNLIPLGYRNPRKSSNTFEIEWQIQFSQAENMLLSSLGHSQIRILLMAQLLVRDHLGENTPIRTQHLRYILFYMCECNMGDWEEERLGIKLKSFMKSLHGCLSKGNFPHYFVSHFNMIDHIPEMDLKQIQTIIKKISENLPLYLMHSIYSLRTSKDFYNRLDIKKLYQIITSIKFQETSIQSSMDETSNSDEDTSSEISDDYEDYMKYLDPKYSQPRKSQSQMNISKINGFDLSSKIQTLTDNRAKEVLKYCANRFVEMARQSNEFSLYNQAFKYLILTENMSTLLREYNCIQEANSYKEMVVKIKIVTRRGLSNIKKGKSDSICMQRKLSNATRETLKEKSKPINLQQYLDEKQKNQKASANKSTAEVKKEKPKRKSLRNETIMEESESEDEQMTAC